MPQRHGEAARSYDTWHTHDGIWLPLYNASGMFPVHYTMFHVHDVPVHYATFPVHYATFPVHNMLHRPLYIMLYVPVICCVPCTVYTMLCSCTLCYVPLHYHAIYATLCYFPCTLCYTLCYIYIPCTSLVCCAPYNWQKCMGLIPDLTKLQIKNAALFRNGLIILRWWWCTVNTATVCTLYHLGQL